MKRILKVLVGGLVVLVAVGGIWWEFFRISPEQKAKEEAADAILQGDGQADEELGDLGSDMKSLGVDSDDEAEADKLLDELLDD